MPRKILLFVICYLLFAISIPSAAFAAVTPGVPTCDLCGWCNPTINPSPPNWNDCHNCLYEPTPTPFGPEVERANSYYTVFGCLSTRPEFFVKNILTIVFAVAGGIAFLAVLTGAAIVLTSSGYPQRLQTGKDLIISSLFGLLLIIFSVFLLRVVGLDILKIPGFG